jgi:hypothetical protein
VRTHDVGSGQWVPFAYRDFYDLPRAPVFMQSGRCYLLDCPFDEDLDDYAPNYKVLALPYASLADLSESCRTTSCEPFHVGVSAGVAVAPWDRLLRHAFPRKRRGSGRGPGG